MPKLIQKTGYIKSGGAGARNYMNYIATRDGVKLIEDKRQDEQYLSHIARRPRSHGLFSPQEKTDLKKTLREIREHEGPVWTVIYSLKREDAARLGFDSAQSWRSVLCAKQTELANAMKIAPKNLRWCAAFHDEGEHPHIHMMVWSTDPKEGYLTPKGIEKMRSAMTNQIFQDELLELYQEKDVSYKEVTEQARASMKKLIREMETGLVDAPAIGEMLLDLSAELNSVSGKKVYGYLKKPFKAKVDAIVDELAKLPVVAECYEQWNVLRDEMERYYKDKKRERLPLSRQKEFRSVKNIVIREAERLRLGEVSFEDRKMEDDPEEEDLADEPENLWHLGPTYWEAKDILYNENATWAEQEEAVHTLKWLWEEGLTVAAHQLGKCHRDGLGVIPDEEQAERWFLRSAQAGHDYAQYALGKLLQRQKRIREAMEWYRKAAARRNQYADYRLGKLYLTGKDVPKDVERAVKHLTASAEAGNQYAQYTLGKLYLMGQEVPQDQEQALHWFARSAEQGNEYAQFFLDRWDTMGRPSVMLSVTRLLHRMAQAFREAPLPHDATTMHLRPDHKLRSAQQEKRIAMGHKEDDHEESTQTWGSMTMRW